MKGHILGNTSGGMPIPVFEFGNSGPKVFILGGVHGDEPEGVIAAHLLFGAFHKSFSYKAHLFLVPAFNLEGVLNRKRTNGRGVDLNRNLPTQDWNPQAFNDRYPPGPSANSEPENQALTAFLETHDPNLIISLHSFTRALLNVNGDCQKLAEFIGSLTGLPVEPTIGYPTPGCLGTYAGIERGMPTLTYELPRNIADAELESIHVRAILTALSKLGEFIRA